MAHAEPSSESSVRPAGPSNVDPAPGLRVSLGREAVLAETVAKMGRKLEALRQAQAVVDGHTADVADLQVILDHLTQGAVAAWEPEEDDLVSVGAAAQLARVGKHLVTRWTREHDLGVKKGGRWFVFKSRLLAFLDRKAGRSTSVSSAPQSVSSICRPPGAEHGLP